MPAFKQLFWKHWYQYLTRRIGSAPVTFLNYGFWPPEGKTVELQSEDEINRAAIQLYHHVASGDELAGKNVLEVSCGHGGGASFVKRYHKPKSYTAIDQNRNAIEYNRKAHGALGIDFRAGDAQSLDFPENHFDAVINVEASHCYPRQEAFFNSVYRVLRRGGKFLYADLRPSSKMPGLEGDLLNAGFTIDSKTDITPQVLNSLHYNTHKARHLVNRFAPRLVRPLVESFAGVEGTGMYNRLQSKDWIYYSYCLVKAD